LREAALQQNSGVGSTLARRRRRRHAVGGTGGQQRSGPGRAVHVLGGVTRAVGRGRVRGVETLRLFGKTRWETLLKTQCWAILFVVLFPCRDEISSVWELYFDSLAYNLS
jgi:hypothetical protein